MLQRQTVTDGEQQAQGHNRRCMQDVYKESEQSVIASDFYYANTIMHLSDEAIVEKVKANLDQCEADFRDASVVDYAVLRFPKAVTHFSPGSYKNRPFQVLVSRAQCTALLLKVLRLICNWWPCRTNSHFYMEHACLSLTVRKCSPNVTESRRLPYVRGASRAARKV
jgi:hypothetical protein